MTLTLLLDLDDTLLDNDINRFLPAYLKALGKHMTEFVAPDLMAQKLMSATQVMLTNNSAIQSLEHSFDLAFYPAIGYSKNELRGPLNHFYDEIYPGLSELTRQLPDAISLARYAQEQGHKLVVATNPLFPYKAIYHRLRWAGLDPDQIPFVLITTYERFHFAKPNPAYFAEILAQLGWPNQPAVMIGNSLEDDLIPAAQLGIPVFWVSEQELPTSGDFHRISEHGSLADVPLWLEKVDRMNISLELSTPTALLAVLKSTPAMLDTLARELTDTQWANRPAPNEWSLNEIFCHMRDVDREINLVRFEKVIADSNPFLPGINSDSWAQERDYQNQDGAAALREFIEVRTQLIAQLENLEPEDWHHQARHAIFGPTNLFELVSFVATHDRSHIQQSLSTSNSVDLSSYRAN